MNERVGSYTINQRTKPVGETEVPFGNPLEEPGTLLTKSQNDQFGIASKMMTNNTANQLTVSTSLITSLLLENCEGKMYDRRQRRFSTLVEVERGHLLRLVMDGSLEARQFNDIHEEVDNLCEKDVLFMKCIEFSNIYLRVPTKKIVYLSDLEVSLLKAIHDTEIRFRFYHDSDLFNFVCQLKIGDRVVVQLKGGNVEQECFKPGWVKWRGELVPGDGFLFGIRFEVGIFHLFCSH
ncbi:unnamed protein product [Thelazia callipaeda]|uniref:TF-B3 domain-containing protein n=1 Tax=Thelazia callipaeda TaxID=103827 RepID=A0A0N5D1P3_THECL|nr:unnamed protein product [Thelazia callipaeda]